MTNEDVYLSDMELTRLNDCAISTRLGMADRGFPQILKKLESLQLVDAKDGGYVINESGLLTLKANRNRLCLPRKKHKKRYERYNDEDDE